jgi:hypothetical protein
MIRQDVQRQRTNGVTAESTGVTLPPDVARALGEAIAASRTALSALDAWAADQPRSVQLAVVRSGRSWKQSIAMTELSITSKALASNGALLSGRRRHFLFRWDDGAPLTASFAEIYSGAKIGVGAGINGSNALSSANYSNSAGYFSRRNERAVSQEHEGQPVGTSAQWPGSQVPPHRALAVREVWRTARGARPPARHR